MTSPHGLRQNNTSFFDLSVITSRPYAIFSGIIIGLLVLNHMSYSHVITSTSTPSSSSLSLPYDLSFTPLVEVLNSAAGSSSYSAFPFKWREELYTRLDVIRSRCGAPCSINSIDAFYKFATTPSTTTAKTTSSNTISTSTDRESDDVRLEVPVNCREIFELEEIDAGDMTFPETSPEELVPLYTLNGAIPIVPKSIVKSAYLNSSNKLIWTKEDIDNQVQLLKNGELSGTYGVEKTNYLRDFVMDHMSIAGKSVLVIGSEYPWVEVAALLAGASKVTTLEYAEIESRHPQIDTYTPSAFRAAYLNGSLGSFDAVLSHSSLEHSGLGRYGDALNPWGDVLAVNRAWCVTKDGGSMMLGLPTCEADAVFWNIHRCYGKIRWPLITMNWIKTDGHEYGHEVHIDVLHAFKKVS